MEPRVPILELIALRVSAFRLSLHGVGGFRRSQKGETKFRKIPNKPSCPFYNSPAIAGRDGEGVRDSDGPLSLGYSHTRNDLRPLGPVRLSKLKFTHVAQ